jgi:integrase
MIGRINGPHLGGKPNPAGSQRVKTLLKNVRTFYARDSISAPQAMADGSVGPERKESTPRGRKPLSTEGLDPLTGDLLNRMLDVLDRDLEERKDRWSYRRALRDRAMLLFAFMSGGRRRSEVATADMRRLRARGKREYVYVMGATKTTKGDENKAARERPVVGAAGEALDEWLQDTGIRSGPIFRRIGRGGRVMDSGITPETVRNTVKRLASRANLDGAYSAHSLRSGFVTEAARQGKTPFEIIRLSGQSVQTAARYYREKDVLNAAAARLIDRPIRKAASTGRR